MFPPRNAHGVVHKRNLPQSVMAPIPDLRSGLDDPSMQVFQGNHKQRHVGDRVILLLVYLFIISVAAPLSFERLKKKEVGTT